MQRWRTPGSCHMFYSVLFWARTAWRTGLEVPDGSAGLDQKCIWILRTWLLPTRSCAELLSSVLDGDRTRRATRHVCSSS